MISDTTLLFATSFAALVALLIGIFAQPVGNGLGLLDRPGGRKTHRLPTPLMGGIALLAGLVPILAAYMLSYEPEGIGHWALTSFAVVMVGCALLGTIDDRFAIPARFRFVIAFLLFGALLIVEPRFSLRLLHFDLLSAPLPLGPVGGWVFTVLVLLGFMNAVNMADGKNGLVMGMGIIWALFLVASGPVGLIPVLVPLAALLGVLILFNLAGKLFLGDGGTYGLSAIIGLAATYSYNFQAGLMAADELILLFIIPIADMMRLIVHRLSSGRSPMDPDRDHLHHYLLDAFGWPGGLFVYLAMVAVPNGIAAMKPSLAPALLVATLLVYFASLALLRRFSSGTDDAAA